MWTSFTHNRIPQKKSGTFFCVFFVIASQKKRFVPKPPTPRKQIGRVTLHFSSYRDDWFIYFSVKYIMPRLKNRVKSIFRRFLSNRYTSSILFLLFVLPSRIAAAEKWRVVFIAENVVGQRSKSTTMTCENRVSHTRFGLEWNAHDVRITRGNTSSYSYRRFCVEKRLTKSRVCGIIFPASERGSPRSN